MKNQFIEFTTVPGKATIWDEPPEDTLTVQIDPGKLAGMVGGGNQIPRNLCVKTGATVVAGGCVWHGDLFDMGDAYMLNCNAGKQYVEQVGPFTAHIEAETWEATFQQDKVVVFWKHHANWFDYDGRPYNGETQ